MAKISIYSPSITVPVVRAAMARPDQTGEVIADQASRVYEAYDRKSRQDANVYAATEASRVRLKYRQRMTKDYNAGEISSGYTGTILEEYKADFDDVMARAPNKYASELAMMAFNDVQGDIDEQSMRYEAEVNISNKVLNLDEVVDNHATTAAMPGTSLEQVRKMVAIANASVAGSGIPTKAKNARLATSAKVIGESWASMRVERDPQGLIDDIEAGRLDGLIDPQQYGAFINRAQATLKQNEANAKSLKSEAETGLRKDAEDAIALMAVGRPLSEIMAQKPQLDPQVLNAMGENDLASRIEAAEMLRDTKQKAVSATPEQRNQMRENARSIITSNPQGAAGGVEPVMRTLSVIDEAEQSLMRAPYIAATNDETFLARKRALKTALDDGVGGKEIVLLTRGVTTAAISAQLKAGVSPERIEAMPKAEAEDKASQVENAPGDMKLALLRQMQETYGPENFQYLKRQLATTFKDPLLRGVLALPLTEDGKRIASTLDINPSDLDKSIDKTVRDGVNDAMARNDRATNFAASFSKRPANAAHLDGINNLVRHAATVFVRDGMTPQAAVEKAYGTFFGNFVYQQSQAGAGSTLRLPASLSPAADTIRKGAYAALNDPDIKLIDFTKVEPSQNQNTVSQEAYVTALKRNGKFLSTADGRGAALYDEHGYIVKVGGKQAIYTWGQLREAGLTARVTANAPMPRKPVVNEGNPAFQRRQ